MSLFNPIRKDILTICKLISSLDNALYIQPLPLINNATIGQHVRHVLEFYSCILLSPEENMICYDNRKRDLRIENDNAFAIHVTGQLMQKLKEIMIDKKVCVQANYSDQDHQDIYLGSTLFRELAYALDHSIHHQAIVKIGLSGMPEHSEKIKSIGVAPATQRNWKNINKNL